MSTSVASVVSHFPDAENGFTTTTAGSVSSGAATVTLNSVAGYTNGEPVVLVIDPTDASKKQTFTGIVDTSGVQITSVVWTAGTNQTHALGATVVDYATATHIAMMSKGIKVEHNQDGTHKAALITSRTEDTNPDPDEDFLLSYDTSAAALKKVKPSNLAGGITGWTPNVLPSVSSVTNNGNRSYDVTFGSTVASYLTPGMRVRTSRTVAAPTGMISLNGSTQYGVKTTPSGMTFTDNFTLMAHVSPSTYQQGVIIARIDNTAANGWFMRVDANGTLAIGVNNAGAGNYRVVNTYQSLPLNKKAHVAMTWAAGTVTAYIDGISVPVATATTAGTAPTAAVAGGDLAVGRMGAFNGQYFAGKIAQAAAFNAVLTAATIKSYASQTLSGSETSCISAFKLDQASGLNDLNANANNLTATGSPTYATESPFTTDATGTPGGTYDFGIVTKVATTVATVQVPEGCTIPTSGGVSAVDLSSVKSPFGFPAEEGRWSIQSINKTATAQSSAVANTWYYTNIALTVPVGAWKLGSYADATGVSTAGGSTSNIYCSVSTSTSSESDPELSSEGYTQAAGGNSVIASLSSARFKGVSVSSATPYYSIMRTTVANNSNITVQGGACPFILQATPSHL